MLLSRCISIGGTGPSKAIISARCSTGEYGWELLCWKSPWPARKSQTYSSQRLPREVHGPIPWMVKNKVKHLNSGGTYHDAKVPYIGAIRPSHPKNHLWGVAIVRLYRMDMGSGCVHPLCQAKVGDLWVHILQSLLAINISKVIMAPVYRSISDGLSGHWVTYLSLDKFFNNRLIFKGDHDIVEF